MTRRLRRRRRGRRVVVLLWWLATAGAAPEDRLISPVILPSPREVVAQLPEPAERARAAAEHRGDAEARADRLRPGGRSSACRSASSPASWRVVEAAGAPLALFGRNLPVAALIPLTILWFGIDETQKVMFIFIACVPFVYSDAVARDRRRARPLRRDGADARRDAAARSSRKVLVRAGAARHLQQPAAPVRPGVRLHHARRADQRASTGSATC